MIEKIILGTVQLGINYGINNTKGKPNEQEAFDILKTAYEEHYPDILNALNDKSILQKLPSISFDKAIIEKSANLAVIESNMLWTDIGSWQSFLYNYCRYSLLGKINDSK